jgi:hypothetical protein
MLRSLIAGDLTEGLMNQPLRLTALPRRSLDNEYCRKLEMHRAPSIAEAVVGRGDRVAALPATETAAALDVTQKDSPW